MTTSGAEASCMVEGTQRAVMATGAPAEPRLAPPERAPVAAPRKQGRLDFVDWARGFACVAMFEAHVFNAWVRPELRTGRRWDVVQFFASLPSSLFLLLAGVGMALKADSMLRRAGDDPAARADARRDARRQLAWRGFGILGFALLFRAFYFLLDCDGDWHSLLRVDILNVIGVSIVLGALVLPRRAASLNLPALAAGVGVAVLTPPVTQLLHHLPAWVPLALTDYVAERVPLRAEIFPIFPMAAYVLLGLSLGGLIARAKRDERGLATLAIGLVVVGGALAAGFHGLSRELDHLYWSPARLGRADWAVGAVVLYFTALEAALVGLCYFAKRLVPTGRFAPMIVLGQTSLLVYFLHIELAYGIFVGRLQRAVGYGGTLVGLALVSAAMVAVGAFRLRAAGWLRRHRLVLALGSSWLLLAYSIVYRVALAHPGTPRAVVALWVALWFTGLTAACAVAYTLLRRGASAIAPRS